MSFAARHWVIIFRIIFILRGLCTLLIASFTHPGIAALVTPLYAARKAGVLIFLFFSSLRHAAERDSGEMEYRVRKRHIPQIKNDLMTQ
ncbi:hypothetical protein [Mucilaginibacter oryzae]|uniref:hypothetical protein n=1 Tax=Mucilaginibacter oryzae TaxID=468058 RepID=UPI0011B2531F|nr:hypothetical protein [Mucilaginibacter oryzae]